MSSFRHFELRYCAAFPVSPRKKAFRRTLLRFRHLPHTPSKSADRPFPLEVEFECHPRNGFARSCAYQCPCLQQPAILHTARASSTALRPRVSRLPHRTMDPSTYRQAYTPCSTFPVSSGAAVQAFISIYRFVGPILLTLWVHTQVPAQRHNGSIVRPDREAVPAVPGRCLTMIESASHRMSNCRDRPLDYDI